MTQGGEAQIPWLHYSRATVALTRVKAFFEKVGYTWCDMRAVFEKMAWENSAKTIGSFYFRPDKKYEYLPGQYAEFHISHTPIDDRGIARTMTLTSFPSEELVSFTAKFFRHGSTFKDSLL